MNCKASVVVLRYLAIILLLFAYYTRRCTVSVTNSRSVNSVANCGPRYNLQWWLGDVFLRGVRVFAVLIQHLSKPTDRGQ